MKGLKNLISGEQISKHSLNKSKTKQQYSFSKSIRFPNKLKNTIDVFYNVSNINKTRTTSFGQVSRSDFKKSYHNTPDPGQYNVVNNFIIKNKKFSFGKEKKFNTRSQKIVPPYLLLPSTLKNNKITLKSRTKQIYITNNNPGPGTYKIKDTMNINGIYTSSKHKNCHTINFKNLSSNKLKNLKIDTHYKYYDNPYKINDKGKYFISKVKNVQSTVISPASKYNTNFLGIKNAKTPGPGSYQLPSEFGVYISSRAKS